MKNKKAAQKAAKTAVIGAAAGFVNGFLGSGGGIILMYMFRKKAKNGVVGKKEATRDAFASTVAAVLPLSAVSAVIYSARNMVNYRIMARLLIPGIIGGILGAILTDKLKTVQLRKIFAAVMIIAGINMIM